MLSRSLTFLIGLLLLMVSPAWSGDFLVLCYHDIAERVPAGRNAMTVSTDNLINHLSWLQGHGWQAVSLADLKAAQAGENTLPEKAFLLTFDDGYKNVYHKLFPILKAQQVPAVLALVTSWLEVPAGDMVNYGNQLLPRENFLTWDQLREMQASGLVEIASHSHNLHHGVQGNPQGNELPALNTRAYLVDEKRYETENEWRRRIRRDLKRSVEIIKQRLGQPPQALAWPYGQYNLPAMEIAAELGMPIMLTLDTAVNSVTQLNRIARLLIEDNPTAETLSWQIRHRFARKIRRVAHVDLDYLYDEDSAQQHQNLSKLLDRIKALQINTVFLQAYADPDGDGAAAALYFPNRHLPVRADLFNRVAWQLRTRAGVDVFAWLPMLAFRIEGAEPVKRLYPESGTIDVDPQAHPRLSPFVARNRQVIREIYEDLAVQANFAGILFSDDGMLSDFEDAGTAAQEKYRVAWGLPETIGGIRSDPPAMSAWSRHKTAELISFSGELFDAVKKWRPQAISARNIFARPVLNPQSEQWFAQELQAFADAYDWIALMAMPWMEQAENPDDWLFQLVRQVKTHPGALRKTIFELQAVDWRDNNRKIPTTVIAAQMDLLLANGAVNFGYYPENFVAEHPDIQEMRPAISLRELPLLAP